MKILKIIVLRFLPFLIVCFLFHAAFLYVINSGTSVEGLFRIYGINFFLTSICLYLVYLIHNKAPEYVGFSYLFLVLFKIIAVVFLLFTVKEIKNLTASFMASYLFSLLAEVIVVVKWVFKQEK